mgnify:CR=1 FL=1
MKLCPFSQHPGRNSSKRDTDGFRSGSGSRPGGGVEDRIRFYLSRIGSREGAARVSQSGAGCSDLSRSEGVSRVEGGNP